MQRVCEPVTCMNVRERATHLVCNAMVCFCLTFAHSFCTEPSGRASTAELWVPHGALGHFLFLEPSAPFFVRSCYEHLWYQVITRIMPPPSSLSKGALVLGTPGIGKSCFLNFALSKLLQLPRAERPTIVLDAATHFARIMPDGTVTAGQREVDFMTDLGDPRTVYLYDAGAKGRDPLATGARVLATSSPNRDQYKLLDVPNIAQFFMPPWSLEEIETYRSNCFEGMSVCRDGLFTCNRSVLPLLNVAVTLFLRALSWART